MCHLNFLFHDILVICLVARTKTMWNNKQTNKQKPKINFKKGFLWLPASGCSPSQWWSLNGFASCSQCICNHKAGDKGSQSALFPLLTQSGTAAAECCHPRWHAQVFYSKVILEPVKLSINDMNHVTFVEDTVLREVRMKITYWHHMYVWVYKNATR